MKKFVLRKIRIVVLSLIASVQILCAQQTGSWGDQGDGTYNNPVLESNYPDNDIIRQGDTYYMMSFTCHGYFKIQQFGQLRIFKLHNEHSHYFRF